MTSGYSLLSQALDRLHTIRTEVERQQKLSLPIIVQLKGTQPRLGQIAEGTVHLRPGQEYRFHSNRKLLGTQSGCYCDFGDWLKKLKPGDKISLNYGRNFMRVVR